MKIVYPPSEKTLQKIETIRRLHETDPKLSYREISNIVKLSYQYVCALAVWDKEKRGIKV